jgi:hypothetical protein
MGNYQITIEGVGPHHNNLPLVDAESIAGAAAATLARVGTVTHATVHAGGGRIDLLEGRAPTRPPVWIDGVQRRQRLELATPAERAIRDALAAVEAAGASQALTSATLALQQALDLVADHVEAELAAGPRE